MFWIRLAPACNRAVNRILNLQRRKLKIWGGKTCLKVWEYGFCSLGQHTRLSTSNKRKRSSPTVHTRTALYYKEFSYALRTRGPAWTLRAELLKRVDYCSRPGLCLCFRFRKDKEMREASFWRPWGTPSPGLGEVWRLYTSFDPL